MKLWIKGFDAPLFCYLAVNNEIQTSQLDVNLTAVCLTKASLHIAA